MATMMETYPDAAVKQESQVNLADEHLGSAIGQLDREIDAMAACLDPVMRPDDRVSPDSPERSPAPARSVIVGRMHGRAEQIEVLASRVRELRERLEV